MKNIEYIKHYFYHFDNFDSWWNYLNFLCRFLSRNNLVGSDIISFHERKEYDDDEKDYSCDQCGKRFLYESSLRTHMSTHTGEKPHVCSYCAKTFRLRKDMIIHERIHTGERPYSCHVCGNIVLFIVYCPSF